MERIAIVFDGQHWHVRHIRLIEHDLDNDEKVYRCDEAISSDHPTLDQAVAAMVSELLAQRRRIPPIS